MPDRLIAIGDIHGCLDALDAILGAIDPGPSDTIVTLGDLIDRGPDSKGVILRLLDLSGRCRVVPILGNHDEMLLDTILDPRKARYWLACGGDATLRSYGVATAAEIPQEHLRFLDSSLDYHEADDHFFTHGSYEPRRPLDQQPAVTLRWEGLRDDPPAPHESGKTAVVGHTSQKSGEILDLGHVIGIDTYCYGGGWLTALEVRSGQLWQADRDGRLRDR